MLNHFEGVAVAINKWAMSAKIYKDWNRTNYINAWKKTKGYVNSRREEDNRQSTYTNFERLAEKWAKEKPKRR